MRNIAALNVFLRSQIVLPDQFKLATEEFRDGWNFAKTTDAKRLEKKIQNRGWNFIKAADGLLRSGVGNTSQEAIASALKQALRRMSEEFNAVEVEHIELVQYPWFFLAKVCVCHYRIQQEAIASGLDGDMSLPAVTSKKLPRSITPDRVLQFRSNFSLLKPGFVPSQIRQRTSSYSGFPPT